MQNKITNKPKKNKVVTEIFIPLIIVCISTLCVGLFYSNIGFLYKIYLLIVIVSILPIALKYSTCVLLNPANHKTVEDNNSDSKSDNKQTIRNQMLQTQQTGSKVKMYKPSKAKVVNNEEYELLRNLIVACVKNKLLSRSEILQFKEHLNSFLGDNLPAYDNITFENDMHEIYSKLKSNSLTTEDYQCMKQYVEALVSKKL